MEIEARIQSVGSEDEAAANDSDEGKYVYCIIEADARQTFPAMGP